MAAQAEPGKTRTTEVIQLSPEHHEAVNRRRRIAVQYDANLEVSTDLTVTPVTGAMTLEDEASTKMLGHTELAGQSVFAYEDEPNTQIDSIYWDMGGPSTMATWPSKVLEPFRHKALMAWWDQGLDLVKALVDATHERGLEAFWNFRVSEVDFLPDGKMATETPSVKKAHPDWILRTTHWSGWNYASPGLRQFQLEVLREMAQNYEFDGFRIDFSRHVPVLPPGEEWRRREALTEFLRIVRLMTLDVERKRGRPFLIAAAVPHTLEGCRADGMDVETWAAESLVDILTLGERSMDVDIAAFRGITAGRNIKLQPCMDTHHATAGYKWQPIEFFRGVYENWWQQGADSVMTFNWSAALQQQREGKFGHRYEATRVELQAYKEIGSSETLRQKNKFFAVERRGGCASPSGGFFLRNDTAPLPVTLANYGRPANLTIRVCDNLRALAGRLKSVTLRLVLSGARDDDQFELRFNGVALQPALRDPDWKDRQIYSPGPQPNTCGLLLPNVNPQQKLLRMDYALPPGLCKVGENHANVCILDRIPYNTGEDIAVEKLEVHVEYV